MKKLVIGMAAAAGLLWLTPGALAGAPVEYKSTVIFDATGQPDPATAYVVGHVTSKSEKCVANRGVKISAVYGVDGGATTQPFDTAKTGKNGGFDGIGPESSGDNTISGFTLKLLPKSIGTKKHPKTCLGDTFVVQE
jgi:hypothetical protein